MAEPSHSPPPSSRPARLRIDWVGALGGALALASAAGLWAAVDASRGFPLDDAWIHQVYARALATEGGMHFNPGVPSSGLTSPLWAALLAPAYWLTDSRAGVVVAAHALGSLLHAITAWLAPRAVRATIGSHARGWELLAAVSVAVCPALGLAALSGMEVALTGALLMAATVAHLEDRPRVTGGLLALAALARPESLSVVVVAALLHVATRPRRRAWALFTALPAFVVMALLALRHLLVTGRPLPATFYMKQELELSMIPERFAVALLDVVSAIPPFWGVVGWLSLVVLAAAPRVLELPRRRAWLAVAFAGAYLAGSVAMIPPQDPAAFYHIRYLLPAVPLLIVAFVIGAITAQRAARRGGRAAFAAAAAVVAVGTLVTLPAAVERHSASVRNIDEVQVALGRWLSAALPPGAVVATSDAGAVRYFSEHPTVDVMGLNTPALVWDTRAFVPSHPVSALVVMPAWFRLGGSGLQVIGICSTEGYRVTSNPAMRRQVLVACGPGGEGVLLQGMGRRIPLRCNSSATELARAAGRSVPPSCELAGRSSP